MLAEECGHGQGKARKFTVDVTIYDSGVLDRIAKSYRQTTTDYLREKMKSWLGVFTADPMTVTGVTETIEEPLEKRADEFTRRLMEYGTACQEVLYHRTLVESCKLAYEFAPDGSTLKVLHHSKKKLREMLIHREECMRSFLTWNGFSVDCVLTPEEEFQKPESI